MSQLIRQVLDVEKQSFDISIPPGGQIMHYINFDFLHPTVNSNAMNNGFDGENEDDEDNNGDYVNGGNFLTMSKSAVLKT